MHSDAVDSDQPIREQLQRGLDIINDHTVRT